MGTRPPAVLLRATHPVVAAAHESAALGVFLVAVLIAGFAGVIGLWWFVIRHAPPDGPDRDPPEER